MVTGRLPGCHKAGQWVFVPPRWRLIPTKSIDSDASDIGAAAGSGEITGPFSDMAQSIARVVWDTTAANVPNGFHWRMLLLTAFPGAVIFVIRGGHVSKGAYGRERKVGLIEFLVPRDIYNRSSDALH